MDAMDMEELLVVQAQTNVLKVKETVTVMLIVKVFWGVDKVMALMTIVTLLLECLLLMIVAMTLTK